LPNAQIGDRAVCGDRARRAEIGIGERRVTALLRRGDRLARANADGRLSDEAYFEQQLVIGRRLGTAVGVIVE